MSQKRKPMQGSEQLRGPSLAIRFSCSLRAVNRRSIELPSLSLTAHSPAARPKLLFDSKCSFLFCSLHSCVPLTQSGAASHSVSPSVWHCGCVCVACVYGIGINKKTSVWCICVSCDVNHWTLFTFPVGVSRNVSILCMNRTMYCILSAQGSKSTTKVLPQ